MSTVALLAVESDRVLREIRELRDRRRQALDADLAEIDRAYEQQLGRARQASRRGRIVNACLWAVALAAVLAMLLTR
jgi:hypothetical protein